MYIIYLGNVRKPLKRFVKTNDSLIKWYYTKYVEQSINSFAM